ncbi:MAG TPA: glutaredoxin domain-containing protein [Tissierellaceae bacterium]|nr:glutaredoxin domain-containing protein [Tissierellaceae bacterium]
MQNIIVYTSPLCSRSKQVTDYLDSQGVVYTEYNVSDDREKALEMVDKSDQQGVPVLDIDGEIVIGFDINSIDELLEL